MTNKGKGKERVGPDSFHSFIYLLPLITISSNGTDSVFSCKREIERERDDDDGGAEFRLCAGALGHVGDGIIPLLASFHHSQIPSPHCHWHQCWFPSSMGPFYYDCNFPFPSLRFSFIFFFFFPPLRGILDFPKSWLSWSSRNPFGSFSFH